MFVWIHIKTLVHLLPYIFDCGWVSNKSAYMGNKDGSQITHVQWNMNINPTELNRSYLHVRQM